MSLATIKTWLPTNKNDSGTGLPLRSTISNALWDSGYIDGIDGQSFNEYMYQLSSSILEVNTILDLAISELAGNTSEQDLVDAYNAQKLATETAFNEFDTVKTTVDAESTALAARFNPLGSLYDTYNGEVTTGEVELANAYSTFGSNVDVQVYIPVGSVIKIVGDNRDPSDIFGFGTWALYAQGRVVVGVGSYTDSEGINKSFSDGDQGGLYEVTMTESMLHSHSHAIDTINVNINNSGGHSHTNGGVVDLGVDGIVHTTAVTGSQTPSGAITTNSITTGIEPDHDHSFSITGETAEGSSGAYTPDPINLLAPTVGVVHWRRVS